MMNMNIRRRSIVTVGLTAGMLGALSACRDPKTVPQLVGELRHPDPGVRRGAADDLSMEGGVPAEAIAPLLQSISVEQDKKAHGAMLITLGRSGVPEAKPHIDGAIPVPDKDVRRWATRALKSWLIANGQMAPNAKLPEDWPYGQPGFPPPLPPEPD
jgi:HEAT repeat protein